MAMCFHCGKKIEDEPVPFTVGGNPVWMHKGCKRWYRAKPLTAHAPDECADWESVDGDDPPR